MEKILSDKTGRSSVSLSFFAAVSLCLILFPAKAHFIFPILGLSFLPLRKPDYETNFILILAGTLLAILLPHFAKPAGTGYYAAMAVSLFSFWLFAFIKNHFETEARKEEENAQAEISRTLVQIKNLEKDSAFYSAHLKKAGRNLELRKNFSDSVKRLQFMTSIEEIKKELTSLLKIYFEKADISVKTGISGDKIGAAVYESGTPLLVKNSSADPRFPPAFFPPAEKSVIAVPLSAFGRAVALVKICSSLENSFSEEDLRTAELLTAAAGISAENLSLFSRINELAVKDALTGLHTHRAFQDRLDEEILSSARTKLPFSLIIADIDHFKNYNDSYGHQAGDEVLKTAAGLFSSSVREIDFTARYGGEEFAFILPGLKKEQAYAFAERLREELAAKSFNFSGEKTGISASFGISEFPSEGASKSQLIRTADERLYRAKKTGRNRCVYE